MQHSTTTIKEKKKKKKEKPSQHQVGHVHPVHSAQHVWIPLFGVAAHPPPPLPRPSCPHQRRQNRAGKGKGENLIENGKLN